MNFTYTTIAGNWAEEVTIERVEGFFDDRPVALCKGDQTAMASERMAQQNMAQQMMFSSQLVDIFNKQYGDQKQVLDYLKGKVQPMIDNPTGFSDEAKAAMRTSATDTLSGNYQNAQKALQASRFANGSRDLPSGVDDQLNAAMLQAEASDKANAQNNITLQDENLKQANMWNAMNVLSGVGAQFNPQSYAGAATGASGAASSAGNSVAGLSQAVTASKQSQLMGALGGAVGGIFQGAGTKLLGCWMAAAVFGENFWTGKKTALVREWLWFTWREQHWYAPIVLKIYSKTGRWAAKKKLLVKLFTPLFMLALRKAQEAK